MGFRDLDVLLSYNSSIHDILNEFYIKVLSEAVSYKRIAGFFHLHHWLYQRGV